MAVEKSLFCRPKRGWAFSRFSYPQLALWAAFFRRSRGFAGRFLESFSVPRDSKVLRSACLYSNLPEIALGWITLISFEESNPKAGKRDPVGDAAMGTMVGLAVSVPDVVDGGSGVYP